MPARASGQYPHQVSVNTSPTTLICVADNVPNNNNDIKPVMKLNLFIL